MFTRLLGLQDRGVEVPQAKSSGLTVGLVLFIGCTFFLLQAFDMVDNPSPFAPKSYGDSGPPLPALFERQPTDPADAERFAGWLVCERAQWEQRNGETFPSYLLGGFTPGVSGSQWFASEQETLAWNAMTMDAQSRWLINECGKAKP